MEPVQPWFENDQWALLLEQAEERVEIAKDEAGNHRHKRMDLLDFMKLQVATCLRVDEMRCVRVRDVKVLKSSRETVGGQAVPATLPRWAKKNLTLDTNQSIGNSGSTSGRAGSPDRADPAVRKWGEDLPFPRGAEA